MFRMSKRWMLLAAIGQGVLFSMGLTGAVRITYRLLDRDLADTTANTLFTVSSVLTGALTAYLYLRYQKQADANAS